MLSQLVILCPFREKRYDQNYELVQSMSFMILSQSIINSKSKVIILFFNTPTDTHYAPIKGSANANGLTLTIITEYTRIPLSDEWKERVKEDIKFLVSEVKTRINLLKEECKKRNANIKPNVLSILEKERQNLIEKKAHDAKLNPFK